MENKNKNFKSEFVLQLWTLLAFLVIGVTFGYLLRKAGIDNGDNGNWYFIFSVLFFLLIGIINLIIKFFRLRKKYKKNKKNNPN